MTKQTQPNGEMAIGDAVNGFGQLKARQISIHGWRVLSWRNDSLTAHEVDLRELSCTCPDMQYNSQDDRKKREICDHLAVALFAADQTMAVGEALNYELNQQILELRDMLSDTDPSTTASNDTAETGGEDVVEEHTPQPPSEGAEAIGDLESRLREYGLDPEDFEYWIDGEYGSLQITIENFLEDDEFSAWQEFSEDYDVAYDGDSDRNYVPTDGFEQLKEGV